MTGHGNYYDVDGVDDTAAGDVIKGATVSGATYTNTRRREGGHDG